MFQVNVCRVCSSRGSYDIFSVIPPYLHGTPHEYMLWTKNISVLIEEITGLSVKPNDNLPNKICAMCISYLKHASTFRQQTINNYLSLRAAAEIIKSDLSLNPTENPDEIRTDYHTAESSQNSKENPDEIDTANNVLPNHSCSSTNFPIPDIVDENEDQEEHINKIKHLLKLLSDKDEDTTNSTGAKTKRSELFNYDDDEKMFVKDFELELDEPENGNNDHTIANDFFNYKEKNFEEDDVLNILKGYNNVTINIPETSKERKCTACYKRFMFEDTYLAHTELCVEKKLEKMIQALNRLHELRVNRQISPHEFIRRLFFSLRKITKWINKLGLPPKTINKGVDQLDQNDKKKTNEKFSLNPVKNMKDKKCLNSDSTMDSLMLKINEFQLTEKVTKPTSRIRKNSTTKVNKLLKLPNQQQQSQNKLKKLPDDQLHKMLNKLHDEQSQNTSDNLPEYQQPELKCSNPNPLLEILRKNSSKRVNLNCDFDAFKIRSSSLTLSAQEEKQKEHEKIIALFEDE